jgi:hypothetical protein
VIVTYGRKCPPGYLPAYSVDTEDEARQLIERCCVQVWIDSQHTTGYVAQELEQEQTLDNLTAFGERLDREYKKMKEEQRATETT